MNKIITHPGSSHKDDFLSVCVLLATLDNAEVFRRDPTSADLADPDSYVVDVGMKYQPELHNFDHHQDCSLPCGFHLIMQHLGLHEEATQMFMWYPHMSMIDVRGPYRTARHLGIDSSLFFAMSSPIDGYILSTFAKLDVLDRQNPLYALMKDLGTDMLALIERKGQRLERLKAEAKVVPVKQYQAVVSEISQSPKLAMDLYLRWLDDERIVMSITPSNRSGGWELLRLGGNTMVDFRLIGEHPQLCFVHGNGFLATTHTRLPMEEVIQLACRALTAADE